MSYRICVVPKYGNFLPEISWLRSPSDSYLSISSFIFSAPLYSMLIQFPKVSPHCRSWFITKHCQVSFKYLLAPLVLLTTEPLHFRAIGKGKASPHCSCCPEIHLLYFQRIPAGYFVIFLFPGPLYAACCFIFLPHTRQHHAGLEAEDNLSLLTCIFGACNNMLYRKWCFPRRLQRFLPAYITIQSWYHSHREVRSVSSLLETGLAF